MANLAGKLRQLVDLELAPWGALSKHNMFALDYIPPIFLIGDTRICVALCSKISWLDRDATRVTRIYYTRSTIKTAELAQIADQSAALTQTAYQMARTTRAHITQLPQARFILLEHNEGLIATMDNPGGQRIKV